MEYRDQGKAKPVVFFYAPILEYPPAGGPQLSVVNAIKVLGAKSQLYVFSHIHPREARKPALQEFVLENSCQLILLPSAYLNAEGRLLQKVLGRFRRVFARWYAAYDLRLIARMVYAKSPDVIWIDRVLEHSFSMFSEIRRRYPSVKLVADTEAVYSRFLLREIPMVKNPMRKAFVLWRGRRKEAEERFIVENADIVTAVSEVDANYFRTLNNCKNNVMLFSNVVDVKEFEDSASLTERVNKNAILIGSFGRSSSPMDRAAEWLVKEVLPLVLAEYPDFKLKIIGRNSNITQAHLSGPNVRVLGRVESMKEHILSADLSLVPLSYESGTRFKIIESGAAGTPVVSTTLGAEGLDVRDKSDILIADDAKGFAEAMLLILRDPEFGHLLGTRLQSKVRSEYSLERQARDCADIFEYLSV